MGHRRGIATAGVVAAIVTLLSTLTAGVASAGPDDPSSCQIFRPGMVQRDAGTAIELYLDHRCWFGAQMDITVETRENGQVRDRFVLTGTRFDGRTVRRVELADKPLCTWSVVEVQAWYRYMTIGDDFTVRRTIWYDPNDNCDA